MPEIVQMLVGRRGGEAFRPAGALDLKGIPEPVEAYEVPWEPVNQKDLPPFPLPPRLIGVPPLAYVGRSNELGLLSDLWQRARAGERRVGLVAGEPGLGKTRTITHTGIEAHGPVSVSAGSCRRQDRASILGDRFPRISGSHPADGCPGSGSVSPVDSS